MLIENLCFSYGEKTIFNNFSIKIPDTGITAVAGPSGGGKTTLLRLLAGLEKPDAGTITCPGPGKISFLFQENRLLPGLSTSGQISVVMDKADLPYVYSLLDAVGLKGEYNTDITELSGGMRRRTALARCLAYGRNKELLLMDEPFAGIDPGRILNLMALIRSMDIPVIYSAHDAHSLSLADRVINL